jgi:hypothetical protein
MTNEQRQFHSRMNEEISGALDGLRHLFDIDPRDIDPADRPEWDILRSNLKGLLLKAYARNHSWINN